MYSLEEHKKRQLNESISGFASEASNELPEIESKQWGHQYNTFHKDLQRDSIKKDNPVIFVSHQTDAIDNALYTFIDAINEYVKVKNISPEEINELKELIFNTYKERKAEVFMSSKINSLLELINNSFTNTIKNSIEGNTKRSVNDFVYYNNRKRSITHEQY